MNSQHEINFIEYLKHNNANMHDYPKKELEKIRVGWLALLGLKEKDLK